MASGFERGYSLEHITDDPDVRKTNAQINTAVAALDHPRAAASIAAICPAPDGVFILIEYWRDRSAQPCGCDPGAQYVCEAHR